MSNRRGALIGVGALGRGVGGFGPEKKLAAVPLQNRTPRQWPGCSGTMTAGISQRTGSKCDGDDTVGGDLYDVLVALRWVLWQRP